MAVEKRIIKGSKKKYKRQKDEKEITKCSLYITLGVNSSFNKGDEAVIIATDEYNKLLDNATDDNTNELNDIITDKDNEIEELTHQIKELTASNEQLTNEIATLKNELSKYDAYDIDDLQHKAKELEQYKNVVIDYLRNERTEYKDLINYLNKCIDTLEHRNIFLRLFNKDNTTDVDKPPLKLIDVNGYILNDSYNDLNSIPIDYSNKSE